jgi:hypothetical protein
MRCSFLFSRNAVLLEEDLRGVPVREDEKRRAATAWTGRAAVVQNYELSKIGRMTRNRSISSGRQH